MGWTYTHKPDGEPVKACFARRFTVNGENRLVDLAVVKVRTGYGAYRCDDGRIIGLVILLDYKRDDWYNFGYKDQDEQMGPYEYDCPERILKLLSPLPEPVEGEPDPWEYAREWRKRCWSNILARRSQPTVRNGMTVRFAEPIRFTDGRILDTFTARVEHGKVSFYDGWMKYRLGDWRKRSYAVVA